MSLILVAKSGFLNYLCDGKSKSNRGYTGWLPVSRWCITYQLSGLCWGTSRRLHWSMFSYAYQVSMHTSLRHKNYSSLSVWLPYSPSESWNILNFSASCPHDQDNIFSFFFSFQYFGKPLEHVQIVPGLSSYLPYFLHFRGDVVDRKWGTWVSWAWVQNAIFQEPPWVSL